MIVGSNVVGYHSYEYPTTNNLSDILKTESGRTVEGYRLVSGMLQVQVLLWLSGHIAQWLERLKYPYQYLPGFLAMIWAGVSALSCHDKMLR